MNVKQVLVGAILFAAAMSVDTSSCGNLSASEGVESEPAGGVEGQVNGNFPATSDEARARARWMHEIIHGALQVMHRDFFDEDAPGSLPSQSLDDVFAEMARSWGVEIRWLGVNATKGRDHHPKSRFEKSAVQALSSGRTEFESTEGTRYRFVGAIRMQNECLKCHVPSRKTLEDRVAGLSISIPYRTD